MKKCQTCQTPKPLNEYRKCKTGRDGLLINCKTCCKKFEKIKRETKEYKEYIKLWRNNNKELKAKLDKDYYLRNKEEILNYKKSWDKLNKEKNKEYYNKRFKENKEYYYALNSFRRENKRKTILNSQEKESMKLIYECAQWASLVFGEPVEVDHIIPLSKGGLHHPDNLQILSKSDNRKKSNKTWNI